jgi:hypothetical protein
MMPTNVAESNNALIYMAASITDNASDPAYDGQPHPENFLTLVKP